MNELYKDIKSLIRKLYTRFVPVSRFKYEQTNNIRGGLDNVVSQTIKDREHSDKQHAQTRKEILDLHKLIIEEKRKNNE